MKRKSSLSFKQFLFAGMTLLLFAGMTLFLFSYKKDEKRFSHITSELFTEEMTSNTLNMHYTLANPQTFGLYSYEPVLSCYDSQSSKDSVAYLQNLLNELSEIEPDKLSDEDAYLHTLLTKTLKNSLALNEFPYFSEPLSPGSGMHTQLPILLAEYTFRSKRDVEDYLALLDQTDEYFASMLLYEQEKTSAGLQMPAAFLQEVRSQCDTIVTSQELETDRHFLQTSFCERLEKLLQAQIVTEEEFHKYLSANNRLLKTVLLPAYGALSDGLLLLEDNSITPRGLAAYPNGADYYRQLMISETGSYRSPDEIEELLLNQFFTEYDAIKSLVEAHPEITTSYLLEDLSDFPYTEASHMLLDLQTRMQESFPALPEGTTQVSLKSVSKCLEAYCAPAFYLTTPVDDSDSNSIYINRAKTPDGLYLYTTLAHEGYPGHLYQNVYYNRTCQSSKTRPVRQILWYGGYLEGWALYVEFLSYDYAASLLSSAQSNRDALVAQLEKHNRSMQLCLYSLLDILIHYDGADYSEIASLLNSFGISDTATAKSIYNYIVQNPCNYLKYYLGYLEILSLQKDAKNLWQNEYSDYRFHKFFLDCGPSDFTSLKEKLYKDASPSL